MSTEVQNIIGNMEFLFEAISSCSPHFVFVSNIRENVYLISETMRQEFGLESRIVQNGQRVWLDMIHPNDRERVSQSIQDALAEHKPYKEEYQVRCANGNYLWIRTRGIVHYDPLTGNPLYFAGCAEKMEDQAYVDPVTGLSPYSRCKEIFTDLTLHNGGQGSLLLLDFDDFNSINILHSHSFGDKVLRAAASEILSILPKNAQLFRQEGDRLFLLASDASCEELQDLFASIQEILGQPHCLEGNDYHLSVSGGIAWFGPKCNWEKLVRNATLALQSAKEAGKNTCRVYQQAEMKLQLHHRKLSQQAKPGTDYLLILVGIDQFKQINDQYGHLVGDNVLKSIINLLYAQSPEHSLIGRYGGDEFLIQPGPMSYETLCEYLENLMSHLRSLNICAESAIFCPTLSLGACRSIDFDNLEESIQQADQAMYLVKKDTKNGFAIFEQP